MSLVGEKQWTLREGRKLLDIGCNYAYSVSVMNVPNLSLTLSEGKIIVRSFKACKDNVKRYIQDN